MVKNVGDFTQFLRLFFASLRKCCRSVRFSYRIIPFFYAYIALLADTFLKGCYKIRVFYL